MTDAEEAQRRKHANRVREYEFGGNRELAIQRDGEKCVMCGMTRQEHREQIGWDITVDHIDGNGSRKPRHLRNNDLSNLQTLCSRCHGRKDCGQNKLTDTQVINIRHIGTEITQEEIAKMYGVSRVYVGRLLLGRWRANLLPNAQKKTKV